MSYRQADPKDNIPTPPTKAEPFEVTLKITIVVNAKSAFEARHMAERDVREKLGCFCAPMAVKPYKGG